jgi:glyoxylase-like metal-dependent hydrolase (beta-lactamase superfamily II)
MVCLPVGLTVLERGWLSSNNVVFTADGDATVVDTGYVSHADQTLHLVGQALQGRALQRIVNTHLHADHAGGNAALQRAHPGAQILIPPGQVQAVTDWDEVALSYQHTGQRCPVFRHDALLPVGQTLSLGGWHWQVLPANGHDAHMVMLWCDSLGVLISADALWQQGFGVLFPALAGDEGAFEAQMGTLNLIESLQPAVVIPGHGAPFDRPQASIDQARDRLMWMAQEPRRHAQLALKGLVAFALLDRQRMTLAEVVALIDQGLMMQSGFKAQFPEGSDAMAHWVVTQLDRVGAAVWRDEVLSLP